MPWQRHSGFPGGLLQNVLQWTYWLMVVLLSWTLLLDLNLRAEHQFCTGPGSHLVALHQWDGVSEQWRGWTVTEPLLLRTVTDMPSCRSINILMYLSWQSYVDSMLQPARWWTGSKVLVRSVMVMYKSLFCSQDFSWSWRAVINMSAVLLDGHKILWFWEHFLRPNGHSTLCLSLTTTIHPCSFHIQLWLLTIVRTEGRPSFYASPW